MTQTCLSSGDSKNVSSRWMINHISSFSRKIHFRVLLLSVVIFGASLPGHKSQKASSATYLLLSDSG